MKEISALIKGLPRGPSLHLLWEDLVRKRAWQRPQRSRRAGTRPGRAACRRWGASGCGAVPRRLCGAAAATPMPARFPRAGNYVPHLCPLPAAALGADLLPASSQGQPRGQVLRREGRQTAGPLRGRAATPVTASTFPNCRDRGARGNLSAKQRNSHRSPEPERCFQVCGFRRCHFKDRPEGGLSVSREVKLPPFCSCL